MEEPPHVFLSSSFLFQFEVSKQLVTFAKNDTYSVSRCELSTEFKKLNLLLVRLRFDISSKIIV
jgi:hypothetical protein